MFFSRRHLFIVGKLDPNVTTEIVDWGPVKLKENPLNLKDDVDGYLERVERQLRLIGICDA